MNENQIQQARQMFGLTFKNLRIEKGLTQTQVADFCGVTFQTVNKIEQGKFAYSIDLLFKLSIVLEFTINLEQKKIGDASRFLLQESQKNGFWTVTDTENQIVCTFENGKFNDTQQFTFLHDKPISNVATIMREFGDWLFENHKGII